MFLTSTKYWAHFYGSVTNHLEVNVGCFVGFNTNFKTSNLCLNDEAYNCMIHFQSCIIYHASYIIYSYIMQHASCIMHDPKKTSSKMRTTSKMKSKSKMKITSKMRTTSNLGYPQSSIGTFKNIV